ncbi:MAG: 30S ribosomal protein S2 [Immundisolibacteraceae bacterium]|nr:30S ribosomal protein S2 [Immundisolibacteraceae bacterium]
MQAVSMRDMLDAGVHFGHQTRFWSPKMAPYIFGVRQRIHIINLEKSLPLFQEALNFLGSAAADGKTILFVGTKRQAKEPIAEYAKACGMPFVDNRWLGGMLTNFNTVRKSVSRLIELEALMSEDSETLLRKKERQKLSRERDKLERNVGGIRTMKKRPDALLVIDTGYESIAVSEAIKLGIPIIGVVDTNNIPDNIDYVIPGNDDSARAVDLYLSSAAEAIRDAQAVQVAASEADEFVEVVDQGE